PVGAEALPLAPGPSPVAVRGPGVPFQAVALGADEGAAELPEPPAVEAGRAPSLGVAPGAALPPAAAARLVAGAPVTLSPVSPSAAAPAPAAMPTAPALPGPGPGLEPGLADSPVLAAGRAAPTGGATRVTPPP